MNKKVPPKTFVKSIKGKAVKITHKAAKEQHNETDKELRSNVNLFRQVFSSMNEMFQTLEVIYNDKGLAVDFRYLEVNPATEKTVNKTRAEMIGKSAKEIFGIVEDYWLEALSHVDKTGKTFHLENYSAAVDKYWDVNFFKIEGRPHTVAILLMDISERKKSEEELAAVHERIQNIIDNMPAIVYAFDLEERFILANKALASLLNSTNEQMIGKRRHEFMPKEDAEWHEANDRKAIEVEKCLEFEEYSQLNGRSITWLTTKFPLRDIHGRIYAVAGVSSDISERKKFEGELKKYNQTLEESVRLRTEELKKQQENLEEMNRNLLRSNKELENFAYIASHDLQEPLRTVTSFTQLLSLKYKDQLDDNAKEYIQFAVDGAKHMYELINGLLAYSRINRKEFTFSKVDTIKVIDLVKANLNEIIKNRNCRIETDDLPEI